MFILLDMFKPPSMHPVIGMSARPSAMRVPHTSSKRSPPPQALVTRSSRCKGGPLAAARFELLRLRRAAVPLGTKACHRDDGSSSRFNRPISAHPRIETAGAHAFERRSHQQGTRVNRPVVRVQLVQEEERFGSRARSDGVQMGALYPETTAWFPTGRPKKFYLKVTSICNKPNGP